MRISISTLIILLFCIISSYGQRNCFGSVGDRAFSDGEVLQYTVNYSAAIVSANVADITFSTSLDSFEGRTAYKVTASGKTSPFFGMFYSMDDRYTTWIDTTTMRPLCARSNLKEGGYLYNTDFRFNWAQRTVNTVGHNIKRNATYRKTMPLSSCSYDAIGLLYNMRSIDIQDIKTGKVFNLSLVLEDTIRNITLRFIGRADYKIDKIGSFKTLKFACKFATSNDETFKDGAEFHVWITDDKNKIPIYLESPIRVGKVIVALQSWKGLTHPFSSIILNPRRQ